MHVADHFPLIRKECEREALEFFQCFSAHGKQKQEGKADPKAGQRGLLLCGKLEGMYNACMEKVLANEET